MEPTMFNRMMGALRTDHENPKGGSNNNNNNHKSCKTVSNLSISDPIARFRKRVDIDDDENDESSSNTTGSTGNNEDEREPRDQRITTMQASTITEIPTAEEHEDNETWEERIEREIASAKRLAAQFQLENEQEEEGERTPPMFSNDDQNVNLDDPNTLLLLGENGPNQQCLNDACGDNDDDNDDLVSKLRLVSSNSYDETHGSSLNNNNNNNSYSQRRRQSLILDEILHDRFRRDVFHGKKRYQQQPPSTLEENHLSPDCNNISAISSLSPQRVIPKHHRLVVEIDSSGQGVNLVRNNTTYHHHLCSPSEKSLLDDLNLSPSNTLDVADRVNEDGATTEECHRDDAEFESLLLTDAKPRHATISSRLPHYHPEPTSDNNNNNNNTDDVEIKSILSATESEVGSMDGLPSRLQKRWLMGKSPREKMLQSLDGIQPALPKRPAAPDSSKPSSASSVSTLPPLPPSKVITTTTSNDLSLRSRRLHDGAIGKVKQDNDNQDAEGPMFGGCFSFSFWGGTDTSSADGNDKPNKNSWKSNHDVPMAILDCANLIHQEDRCGAVMQQVPTVPKTLVRVANDFPLPSYVDTLQYATVDPRMQDWIRGLYVFRGKSPNDGAYHLGKSRTVVVHEINRGNWTWCTAWSPDGSYLAVATENHHLAIIDTSLTTVWRVKHDRRIRGPLKSNTTHSIRSVAWGRKFIAIGGTGNAVSILSSREPYDILHTIPGTGFVGSLHWRSDTNVLAIGSRLDFVMIVLIRESDSFDSEKSVESEILHTIEYKYWVNSVAFSPDGTYLAAGDSGGIVSVYSYLENGNDGVDTKMITYFKRKDSILSIEWSGDGKWLYAGGEDRSVTVVDTTYWEIVHRIGRDRWVQCIASSNSGTHVAVGGVSSEISLLDVENGWDSVMGIELKGLVPLSAKWHPKDQYLAVTGQDNSILAVETTNARHVSGHHLQSVAPILDVEFSPDGRMAIVANKSGMITFYSLSGTSFITAYELVVPLNEKLCVRWSLNGMFAIVGSTTSFIVVGRKRNKPQGKKTPPNASGFSIKKVIREFGEINDVGIDPQSHYIAVSGDCTRILDAKADFVVIREWSNGPYSANSWSPDGRWLAVLGKEKFLTIYDTSDKRVDRWRPIFSMKCDFVGFSLAWGPLIVGGLLYLAYGGDSKEIFIMEIRTHEGTWETVLRIPRDGAINALDWSPDGLLAAAIGNGTVSIIDLAYLQSGIAVNEMDYNWQRQALTCFTEIRRNRGKNSMTAIRWLPAAPGSDRLLAIGGTDGEIEIIDLTERKRCRGYAR
jgi:WD40 repeat protein